MAIGDRQLPPPDQSRIPILAPVMWSQFPRQFDSPKFAFERMTSGWLHQDPQNNDKNNQPFLHARPWIPGGEKSIFMVVIH